LRIGYYLRRVTHASVHRRRHPLHHCRHCDQGDFAPCRSEETAAEREAALSESLRLDFTREAKTLKRAEVQNPKARILCVDDEEVILGSFRKILVLDGYAVDTVETGQEALGLIRTHHYDFVFTDLKMPAMDGVEVTKAVKHLRPTSTSSSSPATRPSRPPSKP